MTAPSTASPASGLPHDWVAEYDELSAADRAGEIGPHQLEQLAVAAFLLGRDDEVTDLRDRAQAAYLAQGRAEDAARCVFWLGFHLRNRGEAAQAAGWMARLQRLVADLPPESPVHGLAAVPAAIERSWGGDPEGALRLLDETEELRRPGAADPDAVVLATMARGHALMSLGDFDGALAALDDAMVRVTRGEAAPQVVGLAYCSVIDVCMRRLDLARAREWTTVLSGWCEAQSGLVPYRGICLVHRAEIFTHHGAWSEATDQVELACRLLQERGHPSVGAAYYQLGELARLRGDLSAAEHAYTQAGAWGHETQPGLALLRLAEGKAAAAAAGISRAVGETTAPGSRVRLLAAQVTIGLADAVPDVAGLDAMCAQLGAEAERLATPFAAALAARACGAVRLAAGAPDVALPQLRRAWGEWQSLGSAYEAARTRVLVGDACRALGDEDAARMEYAAARSVFEELGASPDLRSVDARVAPGPVSREGLSPREVEVIRLVATGATNRAIAGTLMLSEKTVARHLSNIFAKLGVSSRAAATAYAYEHGLA